MNLTQAQAAYDNSYDIEAELHARIEAQEEAIRQEIESDTEKLAEAVSDYYGGVFETDGQELLIEFTLALIGAEPLMYKIAHSDPLCDRDNQAFRELCTQIKKAKRRAAIAVNDAVEARL